MARVKRRRAGLLLAAVMLLFAVFGINGLVAWVWGQHPWWLLGLIVFDIAGLVAVFIIAHAALDPPKK